MKYIYYKYLICGLFLFGLQQSLWSQGVISGIVLNESTAQPLGGASIYINGSTAGTVSSETGHFRLQALPNGFYDVVVSFVGYEVIVYRAVIQSKDISITFKMSRKETELRKVVVLSRDARERWLKMLKENFLGITLPAQKSSIKNEDEILFDMASRDSMRAYSLVPLVVENRELGYRIYFELVEFYYNARNQQTYFYGYSRYEELSSREKIPAKYLRARQRYYRGTMLHFYHTLIDSTTKEEGFNLLNIRYLEKTDSSQSGKQPLVISGGGGLQPVSGRMAAGYPVYRNEVVSKDTVENNIVYRLHWKDKLRVIYTKDPFNKTYLQKKMLMLGSLPKGVYSEMEILSDPVIMDGNGSLYNPLAIQVSGYWSYEKLANMLPMDYKLGKDK